MTASIVTRLKIGMFSPFEKYDSISKTGGKNPMFNSENGLRFFLYPVN